MELNEKNTEKILNQLNNNKDENIKEVKENGIVKKVIEINMNKKEKGNKESNSNIKIKSNKNNEKEKEIGSKRINNFINIANSNINLQHNRYYSTNTSNHYFRNFIKKSNYNKNKNRDNFEENNEQNDFDIYFHFNENRPFSFTSRNNYINKGLNYFLGTINPSNIYNNKNIIDNKKNGFEYKKYNTGKRNNYVNKNIFFNNIRNKTINEYQNMQNMQNMQNINEIKNNNYYPHNINVNEIKTSYIQMNDVLYLDNLETKIICIANNILNNIANETIFLDNN